MPRKNWLKAFFSRVSSTLWAQGLLQQTVVFIQELMGIGSGGDSDSSGEIVLATLLRRAPRPSAGSLCVFDVGSNRGQFLNSILEPLRASGIPLEIHAFEPSHQAFQVLQERFKSQPNIRLNNIGLGNRGGEFDLFSDAEGSGLASLSRRRLDHFGVDFSHAERVRIALLDDYCSKVGVGRIDLLKVDVEGHELDVLQGASRMFAEHRISMVSFEFGGTDIDSRTYFQDFWYFFRAHGPANINRITPTGLLVPITQYDEALEQFRATNYVVVLSDF